MSFLDRMGKIVGGFTSALQAPVGLIKDLAIAPWKDESEFDGFANTIYRRTAARGGQFFGGALGPEGGLGAGIGALPEAVRQPARSVVSPVLGGLETAGREVVREPLTALVTAASLQQAGEGFDVREGYRIAQKRSLGQSIALAVLTKDITDEAEVTKAVGSDAYDIISGTFDAVTRLTLEPDVLLGGAGKLAKVRYLTRPIRAARDIEWATKTGGRGERLLGAIDEIKVANGGDVARTAAQVRDRFFPNQTNGGRMAQLLAEDPSMETLGALLGRKSDLDALYARRADLAGQIDRLTGEQARLAVYEQLDGQLPFELEQRRLDLVNQELDALVPEQVRLDRLDAAAGQLSVVPRPTQGGVRTGVTRSDFFQTSPFARPLRSVFTMRPHRMYNLHDQSADVQVSRMLKQAGVDLDTHDVLRGEFLAAPDEMARQRVILRAEDIAVRTIAKRAGMSTDDIERVLSEANTQRGRADQVMASRKYDAAGRSFREFLDDDGTLQRLYLPVFETQQVNFMPVVDLDRVKMAADKIGQFRLRHPTTDIPGEFAEGFWRLWKPSVLLRVGWPIRVVGDEQLRIMAKIGVLTQVKNLAAAGREELGGILRRVPRAERRAGFGGTFTLRGPDGRDYEMLAGAGAKGDAIDIRRKMASSDDAWRSLVGADEEKIVQSLREQSGQWQTIAPDHPEYARNWLHAVNNQLGKSRLARQFLEGRTVEEVVIWLRNTPEGRQVAAGVSGGRDLTEWATIAKDTVDDYVLNDDILREKALRGAVTEDDLIRVAPDAASRPLVHGEILDQIRGQSTFATIRNGLVRRAFTFLGKQPTDILSRNRFFDHMYRAETTRMVDLATSQGRVLDNTMLREVEGKARDYALDQTKSLLYDLAEDSQFAHFARNLMPFYMAWQETVTRWAGLAWESPDFVARMHQVWRAPEKAGWVTDEEGNKVKWGTKQELGTDRYLTVPLPSWVKDVPGLKSVGAVKFNKEGFNMALQGLPGFGPLVQIPINEIVKSRPELEESMDWVLPFGTTQEIRDMLLPSTFKRMQALSKGEEDRAFLNTQMRIYWDKLVDYNLGKRADKPSWKEANDEAKNFFKLRTVASYVLPASPSFNSPYQLYIDAYRRLKEADEGRDRQAPGYQTPDEIFLNEYGPEFFPLTQSLSKSIDGVPPTLEGAAARKKYQDLIERHPELGGLIVGAEGAGEFSRSVYSSQLSQKVTPGAAHKQREAFSFEEASVAPDVRLGWIEYRRAMDLIEAERIERDLPNLQVKAAGDLAALKRGIIDRLAEKYPDWHASFSTVDRNVWKKRLDGLREIAADKRLAGRADIAGLRDYLEGRDAMVAELTARGATGGAKTLTAASNADLATLWGQLTGAMVERNLAFSDLYFRFLERDRLEVEA